MPIHRDYAVMLTRLKRQDNILAAIGELTQVEETYFSIKESHFEIGSSARNVRKELQFQIDRTEYVKTRTV